MLGRTPVNSMRAFPAVIMVAPRGKHPAEAWMADARLAAAIDLWTRLSRVDAADVVVDVADDVDRDVFAELGANLAPVPSGVFHFGRRLGELCSENGWERLAYFGGASAPLLTQHALADIFEEVGSLQGRAGLVNNLHSSDWLVINDTSALPKLVDRLPKDNMLGWVFKQDVGYAIRAMPPETAFRADLDTPADVIMIGRHPLSGPRLAAFAASSGSKLTSRIDNFERALVIPGNSLAVIGRASSRLWSRLETELSIWVRCYVEERGMVASGRLEDGGVRSLVAEVVETWGPERFVDMLSELAQAVVWDTRVWMAHRGPWPAESDRWAADLGWLDQIEDRALLEFSQAVISAPISIVTGGQGIVGGSLMAALDRLSGSAGGYQPSK